MEFAVLGPLVVRAGSTSLTVTPAQARLLALLLCQPNQLVLADTLADALWGDESSGPSRLQVLVFRLRKTLGDADRVQQHQGSYRIQVGPGELDVDQFLVLRRAGAAALAAGDPDEAVRQLRAAAELWRGDPFTGLDDLPLIASEVVRLRSERLAALEDLYDAELQRGSAANIVTELSDLAAAHPLRERLTALHVLALHHSGRRAEALSAYQRARAHLLEELGLEPGPELRQAQATILAGDDETGAPRTPAGKQGGTDVVRPQQLPPDPAGLIGRSVELAELTRLVDGHGAASSPLVIAIDGSAGIGKTTFAVHAAHLVRKRYRDGQIFVDLRGYSAGEPVDPPAALRTVLQALGVPPNAIPAELDERSAMLRSYLAGKQLLILLDNVRGADQVRPLLPASDCLLLVTSRNQLRGLSIQDNAHRITLRPLGEQAAIGVLTSAVGRQRADSEPAAMSLLTELCGRIPLALRIAGERASRFADHGLAELAEELSDEHQRLDHLGDFDDRAADLRAAFSWSYRTLTTDDARTFRLLGLYPAGTIGLPAAAALSGVSVSQMRRSLDRLVAHHLVEQPQRGRFTLHDLLRLYAAELVAERDPAPAVEAATRRLLDWYLHNAAVAGGKVRPRASVNPVVGPADPNIVSHEFAGPVEALDWFENERQVLPDLLRRAADHGFDDHAWKLAWTLLPFYSIRMHLDDWRTAATIGRLAADRLGDPRAVLFTANNQGIMHLHSSRLDESREAFATALEMARQLGDHAREATSLSNLGLVAATRGDHEQAIEHYELALVAEAEAEPGLAVFTTWLNLSASHGASGHFREAIRYGELAVAYFRENGNTAYEAQALANIGEGHLSLGDFDLARSYCEQSLDLFGTLEAKHGKANTLIVLGRAHEATGAVEAAARVWEEAYDLLHEAGDPREAEVQKLLRSLEDQPSPPA